MTSRPTWRARCKSSDAKKAWYRYDSHGLPLASELMKSWHSHRGTSLPCATTLTGRWRQLGMGKSLSFVRWPMRTKLLFSLVAFSAAMPCAFLLSLGFVAAQPNRPMLAIGWSAMAAFFTFLLLSYGRGIRNTAAIGPRQGAAIALAAFLGVTLCASAFQALNLGSFQGGFGILFLGLLMAWYPVALGALLGHIVSSKLKQPPITVRTPLQRQETDQ